MDVVILIEAFDQGIVLMEKLAEALAELRIVLNPILENGGAESKAISQAKGPSCTGPKIVLREAREGGRKQS